MSEKRFVLEISSFSGNHMKFLNILDNGKRLTSEDIVDLLNEQQATISKLEEEKGYWKSKAMILLMQVRRLTPRMTDKEVMEFSKELEDE